MNENDSTKLLKDTINDIRDLESKLEESVAAHPKAKHLHYTKKSDKVDWLARLNKIKSQLKELIIRLV